MEMEWQSAQKLPGLNRNYFCIDCNRVTRNPTLYLEHRRDYHGDPISIHKCDLCVYASKHSQKLTRHRRTVHRDYDQNSLAPLNSSISLQISASDSVLDQTYSTNDKRVRLATCKFCAFCSTNKTMLIEHIRSLHPTVEIFECERCSYSHWIRDRFNRHRRYHSMDYVQCSKCEFQTIYKWNLERHMKHHNDDKNMYSFYFNNFYFAVLRLIIYFFFVQQGISMQQMQFHGNHKTKYHCTRNHTSQLPW